MRAYGAALLALTLAACQTAPLPAFVTPDAGLAHLPLIETPAPTGQGDAFVVLYSGDGGWTAPNIGFAKALAQAGTPVVGVNSVRYFLHRRSPDEAAADLAAVVEHYAKDWGRPTVVLAGYSFGADALPVIAARLPAATRARVRLLALISPGPRTDLAFRGLSWIDLNLPGALPLAPALTQLGDIRAICIYAQYDRRAACNQFPPTIRPIELPGWHRYRGEQAAVAKIILDWAGLPIGATAR
jgi:type IV secretory pathway VirJ component